MSTTNKEIIEILQTTIKGMPHSLEAAVAEEALSGCQENILTFFEDLLQYGCISGMIGSLIYYHQTREFFDKHYHEIENIRCDLEEALGQPIEIKGELKNFYAWLAFEETARKLAGEIDLAL